MSLALILALAACGGEQPAPAAAPPTASAPPSASAPKPAALPERFELGRAPTDAEVAAWDIDVDATWAGLPAGKGTVAEGKALYAIKCAFCHNVDAKGGEGFVGPRLVATEPMEGLHLDYKAPRAIGNWWPHASTVFDYVRRAMPQNAPGSLTADETYALSAFLLAENGILPADGSLDQDSIKQVVMPTRYKFLPDDRLSTSSFR